MKISYINLFIVLTAISCNSRQNVHCEQFKTGRFVIQSELDNSITIIERNDSLQVERNQITGAISKARIKWISDCEYELYFLSSSDSFPEYFKTHLLKNVITQTHRDYCIVNSTIEGVNVILKDTLRILR